MLFWHSGGNKHLTESFKTKKMYKQREEGNQFTNLKIMIVNKHKIKHTNA